MFMSLGAIGMTIQLLLMWEAHIMNMHEAGSCPGSVGSGTQQGQGCSHWWEEAEGLVSDWLMQYKFINGQARSQIQ
jgi:hypothetical protein